MQEHPSQIVAEWIEERRLARDATALTWLLDALWAVFRLIAGAELQARQEQGPEGA